MSLSIKNLYLEKIYQNFLKISTFRQKYKKLLDPFYKVYKEF